MFKRKRVRFTILFVIHICVTLAALTVQADWQEAGVRLGIQAGPKREYFHQYEVFAVYGLPWSWRTSSGWGLEPQLNTAAGALIGGNETGFIGSAGTGLSFNRPGNGIALEAVRQYQSSGQTSVRPTGFRKYPFMGCLCGAFLPVYGGAWGKLSSPAPVE
jgi:Lipid A 3-O-deacylase (PagL).